MLMQDQKQAFDKLSNIYLAYGIPYIVIPGYNILHKNLYTSWEFFNLSHSHSLTLDILTTEAWPHQLMTSGGSSTSF